MRPCTSTRSPRVAAGRAMTGGAPTGCARARRRTPAPQAPRALRGSGAALAADQDFCLAHADQETRVRRDLAAPGRSRAAAAAEADGRRAPVDRGARRGRPASALPRPRPRPGHDRRRPPNSSSWPKAAPSCTARRRTATSRSHPTTTSVRRSPRPSACRTESAASRSSRRRSPGPRAGRSGFRRRPTRWSGRARRPRCWTT